MTDTYNCDAFGKVISSTGSTPNEFLFAGKQFDPALGFYYMRARYYRPATGRFWTMDPLAGQIPCVLTWGSVAPWLGGSAGILGNLCRGLAANPYDYAQEDPVNRVDSSGLDDTGEYSTIIFKQEHYLVPHIVPTGVPASEVESEVLQAIRVIEQGGDIQGWVEGMVRVRGITFIFRAYPIASGIISVGTIFPYPGP